MPHDEEPPRIRGSLLQQALATLEDLQTVSGHSQWLMPGCLEDKPASQTTMIFALYRMGFHKRTTVHGHHALAFAIFNEIATEVDGKRHRMWSVQTGDNPGRPRSNGQSLGNSSAVRAHGRPSRRERGIVMDVHGVSSFGLLRSQTQPPSKRFRGQPVEISHLVPAVVLLRRKNHRRVSRLSL